MPRWATDASYRATPALPTLIARIAHSLNKLVIAEGVEHAETLDLLRELGVECAQGFHLGRPKRLSPPTALERELRLHAQDAGRQPSPQGAVVAAPMLGR